MDDETTPTVAIAVGTRLKCTTCGSEAIVTQSGPAELGCCDGALEVIFAA
jgi:hypothetical protein